MQYKYKTKPWAHQLKALEYLVQRDTAALYTDMGTGKTKVMIDLIQTRGFKCVLVVAPNKACEVWEEQISIHGIESQFSVFRLNFYSVNKCIDLLSKIPKIGKSRILDTTLVFIINYEKVWRQGIDRIFLSKRFGLDCVICDESHRIKSANSKCSMYLAKLGKLVPHRYLVTGTPMAENPSDIFAQYKFLNRDIFGQNLGDFRDRYENIDPEATARIGHRILDKENPYKNTDELHAKMFSCAFYIESSVELPEQTTIVRTFDMPDKTEKLYHNITKEKVAELNDKWLESNNILTTILRLQQITSGYAKVEDIETKEKSIINIDSARRDELTELLLDFPKNEPIVIFAHYKKDLKNIKRVCKELDLSYSEVSGSVDTLKEWKQGKTQILAVQYSSGSESIDLTRARYCIYYSLTQRLALYEQSKKRIHRPGQTRPVVYYHLIEKMKKGFTIDQKIYAALQSKRDIIDFIMEKGWE